MGAARKWSPTVVAILAAISAVSTTLSVLLNVWKPELILSSIGSDVDRLALEQDPIPLPLPFPFRAVGYSAYALVVTAAYRTEPGSWVVLGLGPDRLYNKRVLGDTRWECLWIDAAGEGFSSTSQAVLVDTPGMGFMPGLYTTLVIGCSFPGPVGEQAAGGALVVRVSGPRLGQQLVGWAGPAKQDDWMPPELRRRVFSKLASVESGIHSEPPFGDGAQAQQVPAVQLVAATETPDEQRKQLLLLRNSSAPDPPLLYEDLYCGSPIYGNVSVLAITEWLSYHFYLFGNKSHFIINDGGAVTENQEMRKALQQWVELGIVSIYYVQHLHFFDRTLRNQDLVINDCMYKHRLVARRIWFFDIDEYILFRPNSTLESVMKAHSNRDVLQFVQVRFSDKLCREPQPSPPTARPASAAEEDTRWTAERLFFQKGPDRPPERKYVLLQPKRVFSTGVHLAILPKQLRRWVLDKDTEAAYYHYHDSITKSRSELCRLWVKPNESHAQAYSTPFKDILYDYDFDDAILPAIAAARHFIRLFFAQRNATSLV